MASVDREGSVWREYDLSFREDAHQLLAWGYLAARPLITSGQEETDITGFIAETIQAKLDSPEIDERFNRYSLKEENPIAGEGRTGKRRMRLDITIESSQRPRNKIRPHYIFEAKRLCRPNQTLGDYLGDEGVLRFLQGRYAAAFPEVAMVGYVQTDTIIHWVTALGTRFDKDSVNRFRITEKLSQVPVIPHLTDEWMSGHIRESKMPITIFHIFLDCFVTGGSSI